VSANGSSNVRIAPYEAGGTIDLGNKPAGSLGLTQAELDRITAGVLRLGDANSGSITVSVPISRAVATDVHLTTGETIIFDSGSLDTSGGTLLLSGTVQPLTVGTDVTAAMSCRSPMGLN
jgi:mucin-19